MVLSAYIRLADVGIGCEPWPQCYAQLNPAGEQKGVTVLTAEGEQMAHRGARIAHRYIASALGFFVVGLFALSLQRRRSRGVLIPALIFGLIVFLSILGYYTPTRSNPLITMGNLLGGMSLAGLLWWLMQRESLLPGQQAPATGMRERRFVVLALLLVGVQVVLGGWSSANYASASCPGLVDCPSTQWSMAGLLDALNPLRVIELDVSGQVVGGDTLGVLSMVHRVFALLTAAYLAWLVRRLRPQSALATTMLVLSVCSIGQVMLGVSLVWFELPLAVLTLHNALAVGLLLACINLLHWLTPPPVFESPD